MAHHQGHRHPEARPLKPAEAPSTVIPATPTNTAAATPANTAAATPTDGATAAASPTPPAQPLEARAEQSTRDNKNAVSAGANLDGLQVSYDSGLLTVSIHPNNPKKDTELLTNGSALVIIAGKAIWTTYPEVQRISVQVFKTSKDGQAESTRSGNSGERTPSALTGTNSRSSRLMTTKLCSAPPTFSR
jgi:hypothetical protein